jgi:hypothetical protein
VLAALLLASFAQAQVPAVVGRPVRFPDSFELGHRLVVPRPGRDFDRDGLEDEGEARLAEAFRPYFVFDASENALRPGEPVTLFQVRPSGCSGPPARCGGEPLRLTLVYVQLWKDDGGYPHLFGLGGHDGDNQTVVVRVESADAGGTFRITEVRSGGFSWPKHGARFLEGRHPWIYFSAGKHHQFFDTRHDGRSSPMSVVFPEAVDGRGPAFLAALRSRLGWHAVGEPDSPRQWRVGSLDDFGFPGEHAFGALRFCGGHRGCDKVGNATATMRSRWDAAPYFVPGL